MTTTNPIKCAVIGLGYLGKFHAEKYGAVSGAELVAVCDTASDALTQVANKLKVATYVNYRDLIGKVDAVSIATPTIAHFAIAKFFLENGVHVLLEKPIAQDLKEAEELVTIAQKNPKLVFQIGHLERLNSTFMALNDRVKNPVFIEARRLCPIKNRATDVSVVVDLMIHDIDLILQLAQSQVKHMRAVGYKLFTDVLDFARAEIILENGCVASLVASRVTPNDFAERSIKVIEVGAYHQADLASKTLISETMDKKEQEREPKVEKFDLPKNDALQDEIKAFLTAIKKQTPPLVDAKIATNALAIALAIERLATKT